MSPLYLYNGKLLLKDTTLATSENCCCVKCKYYYLGSPDATSIWGDPGIEIFPGSSVTANLQEICIIICGQPNSCSTEVPPIPGSDLSDWIRKGGIVCVKGEYEGCGNLSQLNSFLSSIGSSIQQGPGVASCPGPAGYTGFISSYPVTEGMGSSIQSAGLTGNLIGGNEIITAPSCQNPEYPPGVACAGEQLGRGAVFVVVDSNLSSLAPLAANAVRISKAGGNYF